MYPVIQLGNVSVSVYALLIVAGIAAGCIAMRPFSASFGIEKEDALYATLFGVLGAAVGLYHTDKKAWKGLMKNAMTTDFSWGRSAGDYLEIYGWLTGK